MLWRNTFYLHCSPDFGAGPLLSVGADSWKATTHIFIDGSPSKVATALKDFLGYSEVKTQLGVPYISRTVPYSLAHYRRSDPSFEGMPILWCSGFSVVENMTKLPGRPHEYDTLGNPLPLFKWAKVQLTFQSYRYSIRPDTDPQTYGSGAYGAIPDEAQLERFVFRTDAPKVRTITTPVGTWSWEALGAEQPGPAAFGVPVNEGVNQLVYTHFDRPDKPDTRIARALGTVNSVAFDGHAAGTLLCDGPTMTPGVMANGAPSYTYQFRFSKLSKIARTSTGGATAGVTVYGHNHFLRKFAAGGGAVTAEYRRLLDGAGGAGNPVYRSTDFAELFRPE